MSTIRTSVALLLLLIVASALPVPAAPAKGTRVSEGTLFWRTAEHPAPGPAPVVRTDVELRVTGMVARATVRQEFTNPSDEWAEALYVFPLPDDAAVDHLRMWIGDRVIDGVIQERAAAKATYEQAKHEGKRTSLVEQERPNVFTTSLANIPPGAAIAIEIEYQHAVRYDAGRFRLRFPMVVGPRYIPGVPLPVSSGQGWAADTDAVPDASRITPLVAPPGRGPINPVSLRIELDPGVPLAALESPYHRIHTTPLNGGRFEIRLEHIEVPADRDFELVWQPAAGAEPTAALFTDQTGDRTYALLMLMPPRELERRRAPREVIFVLDNSGSMAGASIEQARAALKLALARLQPGDSFNVVRFNHRTDSLFAEAQPASRQNLEAAERYVDGIRASGGTEMLSALMRALAAQAASDRLRQVIFLTDGEVGNEEQLFQVIRQRLGDSRLFTIGIGSAPNSHFMREAARLGRGTFTYIGSPGEVQDKMLTLFRKLESPAITDLHLELPGAGEADVLPARIPDLYLGEPVMLTLRTERPPSRAVLRGQVGSVNWEQEVALQQSDGGSGLSVHWARAQIAALLDARGAGGADDTIREAVLDIALAHHLVSPYTSLVAVDVTPARPDDAGLATHALETNLPAGWDYQALLGFGQGATAAPLHIVVGVSLLLAAAVLVACRRFAGLAS